MFHGFTLMSKIKKTLKSACKIARFQLLINRIARFLRLSWSWTLVSVKPICLFSRNVILPRSRCMNNKTLTVPHFYFSMISVVQAEKVIVTVGRSDWHNLSQEVLHQPTNFFHRGHLKDINCNNRRLHFPDNMQCQFLLPFRKEVRLHFSLCENPQSHISGI